MPQFRVRKLNPTFSSAGLWTYFYKLWRKMSWTFLVCNHTYILYKISLVQYTNKICRKSFIHSLWGISNTLSCFCDLQMKYNQVVPSGGHYLWLTVTNRFGLSSPSTVTNRFLKIFETTEVPESNAEISALKKNPYACPH